MFISGCVTTFLCYTGNYWKEESGDISGTGDKTRRYKDSGAAAIILKPAS
jgi:hypothetical protein